MSFSVRPPPNSPYSSRSAAVRSARVLCLLALCRTGRWRLQRRLPGGTPSKVCAPNDPKSGGGRSLDPMGFGGKRCAEVPGSTSGRAGAERG